ncbi:GBF-interacting protein like [Heracleum sosnowskyi]|uniref:GBF-interacting protein like n=1 Tax=Heracleum sosnowskyi TaxID=360622 RepID=A0AAD8J5B9_9APIA|nr:GBF-interacting protein like [Heracleum sosnowskyi]
MEGEKRTGCSSKGTGGSSSSFASDLFGTKDSSSSASSSSFSSASSGIFGSIFASNPPNLVVGRESLRTHAVEKKHAWNSKTGLSDSMHLNKQGESMGTWKDPNNTYYTEQNVQPCHLSSSIYYGGQDVYTTSYNSQSHDYSTFKKDQGEDDSGSASRGNWWQGGLYY